MRIVLKPDRMSPIAGKTASFLLALTPLMSGCEAASDQAGAVYADETQRGPTGIVRHASAPLTGTAWRYHVGPEAAPKERTEYVQGHRNGTRLRWYPDGRLAGVSHFEQGRLHGLSTSYWPNGAMRAQTTFVGGQTQGTTRQWYREGMPFKERALVQGRERGLQRAWRRNGKLYANYEATGPRNYGLHQADLCVEVTTR